MVVPTPVPAPQPVPPPVYYACIAGGTLGYWDSTFATFTAVGPYSGACEGLSFNSAGVLYGVFAGTVKIIDTYTNTYTTVGSITPYNANLRGFAIDGGTAYGIDCFDRHYTYQVDLATFGATHPPGQGPIQNSLQIQEIGRAHV